MILDEHGNPVTTTDGDKDPNDVIEDPSASSTNPDPNPDEDPSSSEPQRRKPGAEERIGQVIGEREYWKGRAEAAEMTRTSSVPPPVAPPTPATKDLDPNDFDNDADYLKAVGQQVKEEIEAKAAEAGGKAAQETLNLQIRESAQKSRETHEDFDSVALNPAVPTTQTMVDAMGGENYAEILYALGSNISEAMRIASLPPIQQIKEIGLIEARITKKPERKITSAPAPVPVVDGTSSSPIEKDETKMTRTELHTKWGKEREDELRRKYG